MSFCVFVCFLLFLGLLHKGYEVCSETAGVASHVPASKTQELRSSWCCITCSKLQTLDEKSRGSCLHQRFQPERAMIDNSSEAVGLHSLPLLAC